MKYSRIVWATALETAVGMGDNGQCASLRVAPRMMSSTNRLVDTLGELTIINTGPEIAVGDKIAIAQDISGFWVRLSTGGGGGESVAAAETNPGVVTVEIATASPCLGELFADLGFHAFRATITSRPFGSPASDLMRKEIAGNLTIFDPTGCILDLAYDVEDFLPATGSSTIAFVSLMYGGTIFEEEYNFKTAASGVGYVNPDDEFETYRPIDSCKPFGFDGGVRIGYTASIGIAIGSIGTFKVKLPERGIYEIKLTYGDATDPTYNLITILDDIFLLTTLTDRSNPIDVAQTWTHTAQYNFMSSNAPILRITLNNAPDADAVGRESRIVKLEIKQISSPTRWEVINRCCIPKDLE